MAYLVLVRHGESEWNALGKFAGLTDISLTPAGRAEAQKAAEHLRDIQLHKAHVSVLKRAKETLAELQAALQIGDLPANEHADLNERDYGDATGKNKKEMLELLGEDEFKKFRRAWDYEILKVESLKKVHDRVVKYYLEHILQDLRDGKNILVVSHHNTLRALMKYLEDISSEEIENLELGTAEVLMYEVDQDGKIISKHMKSGNKNYSQQS